MLRIMLIGLVLTLAAAPAQGKTYKWIDGNGTVNFTENLSEIPAKYRKKAIALDEQEPAYSEVSQPAGQEPEKEQQKERAVEQVKGKEAKTAEKNVLYGGKDEKTWRRDFGTLRADLRAAEQQLADLKGSLANTDKMGRTEYLRLQDSVKVVERRVGSLRTKLDELNVAADRAKVPQELR